MLTESNGWRYDRTRLTWEFLRAGEVVLSASAQVVAQLTADGDAERFFVTRYGLPAPGRPYSEFGPC